MKILPFLVHFGSILSVVGNIENIINVEKIHTNYNETITELLGIKDKHIKIQFVFTYNDRANNINLLLHTDYLNYRIKLVGKRHPRVNS